MKSRLQRNQYVDIGLTIASNTAVMDYITTYWDGQQESLSEAFANIRDARQQP
jgi:hypothetical protein